MALGKFSAVVATRGMSRGSPPYKPLRDARRNAVPTAQADAEHLDKGCERDGGMAVILER
jgi:hypothetical protein